MGFGAEERAIWGEEVLFPAGYLCVTQASGMYRGWWLPRAFRDVQRDRHGRPFELITDLLLTSGQAADEAEGERQEFDGSVVGVEVFVIEEGHTLLSAWGGAWLREREGSEEIAHVHAHGRRARGRETGDGRRKTTNERRRMHPNTAQ